MRRRLSRAAVIFFAATGCAFWAVVVGFSWAYRTFVFCMLPCPEGPQIVFARTLEAIGWSVWLAIDIIAFVIFMINRRQTGTAVLTAAELISLVLTAFVGQRFFSGNDPTIGREWFAGSLIAVLTLVAIYVFSWFSEATPDAMPRSGQSRAPGGESVPPRPTR